MSPATADRTELETALAEAERILALPIGEVPARGSKVVGLLLDLSRWRRRLEYDGERGSDLYHRVDEAVVRLTNLAFHQETGI